VGFLQILIFGLSGQYWNRNWVVVIGFQLGCFSLFPPILFIWKIFVLKNLFLVGGGVANFANVSFLVLMMMRILEFILIMTS
jgi:hypothetical protein